MKRLLFLLLLFLLIAAALAGCASGIPESTMRENATTEKEGIPMENNDFHALLDRLGYAYEILDDRTVKGDLIAFFDAELEKGRAEGYTPVLVAGNETGGRSILGEGVSSLLDSGFDIEGEREKALSDGKDVLNARRRELEDVLGASVESLFEEGGFDEFEALVASDTEMFMGIQSALMFGGEVALVRLPTQNPWEAAIMIPFGGFNECPAPSDMAAVLKYWYEQYGAVPAVITYDSLDLRLPAPISGDAVKEVAVEQIIFDLDIAQSGAPLPALEAILAQSRVWSFWWD